MKAKNYEILSSEGSEGLERQVKNRLEEGWELNGKMEIVKGNCQGISYTHFVQGMFLPSNAKSMEEQGYKKIVCDKCEKGHNRIDTRNGWFFNTCFYCKGRGFNWKLSE